MAIEGKALSRSPEEGGRPRRGVPRRAEVAFGLLSIAVMRRKGAHSGLNWAGQGPERVVSGRARRETRDSNGAETKVKADFACATIQDGPFVDIDEPAKPAIGEWRQASPYGPVRGPVGVTGSVRIGQHNRLLGSAVRFGHTGRDQDHYRSIGAFGKILCHCAMNATESQ